MDEPLRPSNFGEILDRTVQIYRSRFLVLFGIAAVPTAVVLVGASGVFLFFAWFGTGGGSGFGPAAVLLGLATIGIALVAILIYFAANALAVAALNHAAARAFFAQKTTIRDAYKAVWARGWRYIGLVFLEALIIAGPPLAVWFLVLLISMGGLALAQALGVGVAGGALVGILAVVVVLALVAYCIWMALRLSLAFPASVVEQTGAWAALKRSASLSQGTRGRIFLLYLLGGVLNYVFSMVTMVPILIGIELLPGAKEPQNQQSFGMAIMFFAYATSFAVQALTKPVYGIAMVLFYYDQRIRLEGFDIEWMMQRAGLVVPQTPVLQQNSATFEKEENGGFNPGVEHRGMAWASAPEASAFQIPAGTPVPPVAPTQEGGILQPFPEPPASDGPL